ncbi:uncharacterized protein EHS24_000631 [Apiotrichum porosum]|uniref:Mediator of RNA polymerase II transcription subunit 21 n=1 Tax=Apiotrichum porosum TaxID=105984 RepID=A0A427YAS7_9TREE|nr:uncharacterized protein EHS24_000631 [Apiotrichum porosum]RSH88104.1 hypothetical protein EHS24_000631 [Apiotrichum porosum]
MHDTHSADVQPAASHLFPQCDGLGRDMLSEELSTDMDRITQLQDAILDLLTITSASIEYITHRTQFEQTSAAIPTTLQTAQAARRKEYRAAIETFVADIVRRAKDVETLTAALPSKDDSGLRAARLQELQTEMVAANVEYKEALAQAEALLGELRDILRVTLGDGTERNIVASLGRLGLPA